MPGVPLSEDARLELTATAARAERANKPRTLLLVSLLLLAVSLLVLSMAWSAYSDATGRADAEQAKAAQAVEKSAQLVALGQAATTGTNQANEPISKFRSRIERAGVEAGLREPLRLPSERNNVEKRLGTRQVLLTYEIRDPSFDALTRFMQRAVEDVPGLEVSSVLVRPEAQVWYLQVVFSRWERLEGT